jgi:hypothetical protein
MRERRRGKTRVRSIEVASGDEGAQEMEDMDVSREHGKL